MLESSVFCLKSLRTVRIIGFYQGFEEGSGLLKHAEECGTKH